MNVLDEWMTAATEALGLDGLERAEQQLVLDVAKVVAHGVVRPGAPLTAYLLGIAVGRGADPRAAAGTVTRLVESWASRQPDASTGSTA